MAMTLFKGNYDVGSNEANANHELIEDISTKQCPRRQRVPEACRI